MNWIKNRLLLILGGLLTASVFLLQIFGSRMKRLKRQKEQAEAQADKLQIVMEQDNEIEEQTRSRRADALKEINDSGDSSIFDDANKLRRKRND